MTLLVALIEVSREFHDEFRVNPATPLKENSPGWEYTRGQAELIMDSCSLSSDDYRELVMDVITHQISVGAFLEARRELLSR
jgi:hypothetical protein